MFDRLDISRCSPCVRKFDVDVAVVATVIVGLMFNVAGVDSNIGKANNIDQQASQQAIQHMCNGTTKQPIN